MTKSKMNSIEAYGKGKIREETVVTTIRKFSLVTLSTNKDKVTLKRI